MPIRSHGLFRTKAIPRYLPALIVCLATARLSAQPSTYGADPPPPLRVGFYAELGLDWNTASTNAFESDSGDIGAYFALPRLRLEPGLDVRKTVRGSQVVSNLVGPRIGHSFGRVHPYAEALFGTGHVNGYDSKGNSIQQSPGVTAMGAAGFDIDYGGIVEWRVIEISYADFTGVARTRPFALSGGVALRFSF